MGWTDRKCWECFKRGHGVWGRYRTGTRRVRRTIAISLLHRQVPLRKRDDARQRFYGRCRDRCYNVCDNVDRRRHADRIRIFSDSNQVNQLRRRKRRCKNHKGGENESSVHNDSNLDARRLTSGMKRYSKRGYSVCLSTRVWRSVQEEVLYSIVYLVLW